MSTKFEVQAPADQKLSLAPLAYVALGVVAAVVTSITLASNGFNMVLAILLPIAVVVTVVTIIARSGAAKARRQYAADLEVFLAGIKTATGSTLVTNGQTINFNDLPEYAVLESGTGFSRWSMKKEGTTVRFQQLEKKISLPRR